MIPPGSVTGVLSIKFCLRLEKPDTTTHVSVEVPVRDFPDDESLYHPELLCAILAHCSHVDLVTTQGDVVHESSSNMSYGGKWCKLQGDDLQHLVMYVFEGSRTIRRMHDPWSWHDRVVQCGLGAFIDVDHLPIQTPEQDTLSTYVWYLRDETKLKEQEDTEEELVSRVEGKADLWWTRTKRKREEEE